MLSVPVLTRSPSRLQFLLAIATRLPSWPGPGDLQVFGNIVCLGPLGKSTQLVREGWWWGNTSDVIFVSGVDFFHSSVAEGQLSHPVHASAHTCGQAEVSAGGRRVEAVCAKVVRAESRTWKNQKVVGQFFDVTCSANLFP